MQAQLMAMQKLAKISQRCIEKVLTRQTPSMSATEKKRLGFCIHRYFDTQEFLATRLEAKTKKMGVIQ